MLTSMMTTSKVAKKRFIPNPSEFHICPGSRHQYYDCKLQFLPSIGIFFCIFLS